LDASVSCTRAASVESVLEESSTHQRRIALILPTALRAAMYTCRKPQASRRMGGFIGTGNTMTDRFDAIVVGAGLAGLTAAAELTRAGKRTLLLDQEGEQNLGGQAFWSFGGLFFVDSPEQRRMGVKDSRDLAMAD